MVHGKGWWNRPQAKAFYLMELVLYLMVFERLYSEASARRPASSVRRLSQNRSSPLTKTLLPKVKAARASPYPPDTSPKFLSLFRVREYFYSPYNLIELANLATFVVVLVLRVRSLAAASDAYESLCPGVDCGGGKFVNLFPMVALEHSLSSLNAFNALLACLKFFKYVLFSKRLLLFCDTVAIASAHLGPMLAIIGILLTGFGFAFMLTFGASVHGYRDFGASINSLFSTVNGDFTLGDLRTVSKIVGPALFFLFISSMVMVVLSMIFAIVNAAYNTARGGTSGVGFWDTGVAEDLAFLAKLAAQTARDRLPAAWQSRVPDDAGVDKELRRLRGRPSDEDTREGTDAAAAEEAARAAAAAGEVSDDDDAYDEFGEPPPNPKSRFLRRMLRIEAGQRDMVRALEALCVAAERRAEEEEADWDGDVDWG